MRFVPMTRLSILNAVVFLGACKVANHRETSHLASDGLSNQPSQLHPIFERYEGGSLEAEIKLIGEVGEKFVKAQMGVAATQGRPLRGTHAKGSCIEGMLTLDELPDRLFHTGPFGIAKAADTRMRFANSLGRSQPDTAPDLRSLSISFVVKDDQGKNRRYDFAMNNDPAFPFQSISDLNHFMGYQLQSGGLDALIAKGEITPELKEQKLQNFLREDPERASAVKRVFAVGLNQQKKAVFSYTTEDYGTGSAYLFGNEHAAKFTLTQCSGKAPRRELPADAGSNYLQEDLRRVVTESPEQICFDLNVQLLDAASMRTPDNKTLQAWEWVENPALDWDQAGAKSYKLGRLVAKPNSFLSDRECDDVSFAINPTENTDKATMRLLGRINRARAPAENRSKEIRQGQ